MLAGLQVKILQSHRPSAPQRAHSRSFPPALLPKSRTEHVHNNCSGRLRHLSASRPPSWHKPRHKKVSIQPKASMHAYLQRCKALLSSPACFASDKRATCTLRPGTNAPESQQSWAAVNAQAEPEVLFAEGDVPASEGRSEAPNRQSIRADAAQPEQGFIWARCSPGGSLGRVKGVRAGSGARTYPKASGSTAWCCKTFLPTQLRVSLLFARSGTASSLFPHRVSLWHRHLCICPRQPWQQPSNTGQVLSRPNYAEQFPPEFGCFQHSLFYRNCRITLSASTAGQITPPASSQCSFT